jgi:hypothetical protein
MLQQFVRCITHNPALFELGIIIFLYIINLFEYFSSTSDDEMCNFYMMYWVDGDQLLEDNVCASPGPPNYYFAEDQVS